MTLALVEHADGNLAVELRAAYLLRPFQRGFAIEDALGRGSLPRNYPFFDVGKHIASIGPEMISIKSRDCHAKSYSKSSDFVRRCVKDIDTVRGFEQNPFWVHHEKKMTILNWSKREIGRMSLIIVARGLERYPDVGAAVSKIFAYAASTGVSLRVIAL
jgi:hypothetical protein